jgi:hypothetical protein
VEKVHRHTRLLSLTCGQKHKRMFPEAWLNRSISSSPRRLSNHIYKRATDGSSKKKENLQR